MLLVIHDLDEWLNDKIVAKFKKIEKDIFIVSDNGTIKNCIGCFGCWIKTPGRCVLNDDYNSMGELLANSEHLVIISECIYGTYSPFVRNVLDRCLPYIHPDFVKRNGEIHHKPRYKHKVHAIANFYNAKNVEEKKTAASMVNANMLNFNGIVDSIEFFDEWEDIFFENSNN